MNFVSYNSVEIMLVIYALGQFEISRPITPLIIYMKKFLNSHWLRTCQLIPNSAISTNWVQFQQIKCNFRKLSMNGSWAMQKQNGGQKWNKIQIVLRNFNKKSYGKIPNTKTNTNYNHWEILGDAGRNDSTAKKTIAMNQRIDGALRRLGINFTPEFKNKF